MVSFRTVLLAGKGNNVGIVVPDEIVLGFGRSSAEIVAVRSVRLVGATREVGDDRALHAAVEVTPDV